METDKTKVEKPKEDEDEDSEEDDMIDDFPSWFCKPSKFTLLFNIRFKLK